MILCYTLSAFIVFINNCGKSKKGSSSAVINRIKIQPLFTYFCITNYTLRIEVEKWGVVARDVKPQFTITVSL
jgi:hypothetical protein